MCNPFYSNKIFILLNFICSNVKLFNYNYDYNYLFLNI